MPDPLHVLICHDARSVIIDKIKQNKSTFNKLTKDPSISDNILEFFTNIISSSFGKADTKVHLAHTARNFLYGTSNSTWIVINDDLNIRMIVNLVTHMSLTLPKPKSVWDATLSSVTEHLRSNIKKLFGLRIVPEHPGTELSAVLHYTLTGYIGAKKLWTIDDLAAEPIIVHNSAWIHQVDKDKRQLEEYEDEWREWFYGQHRDIQRVGRIEIDFQSR